LINIVAAIIDFSTRGLRTAEARSRSKVPPARPRPGASADVDAQPARFILGWCRSIFRFRNFLCRAGNMHNAIALSERSV
jgi:hypothetical protein